MKNDKNCKLTALLCVFVLVTALFLGGCAWQQTATRLLFMMDTFIEIEVRAANAEYVCDKIETALRSFEREASMYVEGSELWQINESAAGAGVQVSDDLYYVIERAVACGRESDGLFDVTIGPLSLLWDVTAETPVVPDQQDIDAARALVDYQDILLSDNNIVALARPGQKIDLGGIAKGYALDLCKKILDSHNASRALISIGGNVFAYKSKGNEPFLVGIRYPEYGREAAFCALHMTDSVVSTTGGYERYFIEDDVPYQHVLDPRTGWPVQGDILSVSVVLPDGLTADYMSTRLFVGGLDYTLGMMRGGAVEAIVVSADNKVYITASLQDRIVDSYSDTQTYEFIYV